MVLQLHALNVSAAGLARGVVLCLLFALCFAVDAAAQSSSSREYNIPPGPLDQSLRQFASEAGITLSFTPALVDGQQSPGLRGVASVLEGLTQLLRDSELTVVPSNGGYRVAAVNPPAQRALFLQPITVKGELIERDLQDTQTSVSVVTGEMLDRGGEKNWLDIAERIPNFNLRGFGQGFAIRGITDGGPGGAGQAQAISYQVDGAPLTANAPLRTGPLATWDLQQVEVLRGPQSTQQGPNSLAGAIVIRSQDPTFEREFKARADFARYGEKRWALAANLPLSDKFALRVAAEDYRTDGDITYAPTGDDGNDQFTQMVRAKLRFRPSDAWDIVLGVTSTDKKRASSEVVTELFPEDRISDMLFNEQGDSTVSSLTVNGQLTPSLSVSLESSRYENDYFLDSIPAPGPFSIAGLREREYDNQAHELRFNYQRDRVRAVAGLYWTEREDVGDGAFTISDGTIAGFPPGVVVFGDASDIETTNEAVFVETEFDLNQHWKLIAGARYDNEERNASSVTSFTITPDPSGLTSVTPATVLEADYSAFLPKLGVVYQFAATTRLGFTAQKGYRAGGSALTSFGEQYEYDPEFTINYELSLRHKSDNGRWLFNVNVFYTDYDDIQVSLPGPTGTFLDAIIENAGEAELYGLEIQSEFELNQAVFLFANLGVTETNLETFVASVEGVPTDISGNEFQQAPQVTGSFGIEYWLGNHWFAEIDASYTDTVYSDILNVFESDAYTLVNARLGYEAEHWTLSVFARNLFDEEYLELVIGRTASAGDSRVVGLSLTGRF